MHVEIIMLESFYIKDKCTITAFVLQVFRTQDGTLDPTADYRCCSFHHRWRILSGGEHHWLINYPQWTLLITSDSSVLRARSEGTDGVLSDWYKRPNSLTGREVKPGANWRKSTHNEGNRLFGGMCENNTNTLVSSLIEDREKRHAKSHRLKVVWDPHQYPIRHSLLIPFDRLTVCLQNNRSLYL